MRLEKNKYKPGISIIICSFNGASRLIKTFEFLNNLDAKCDVEILFIDNNSNDDCKSLIDMWCYKNLRDDWSYKSYVQKTPGKTFALEMAYDKSKMEFLLICDDDNWLDNNYLNIGYDLLKNNPRIGALGGRSVPFFEKNQPEWWNDFSYRFACGKQCPQSGDITHQKGCLWGAGMFIRKKAIDELRLYMYNPISSCRTGEKLISGGDTELCYALRLLNYQLWYEEKLIFTHFISKEKCEENYLKKLLKGISSSSFDLIAYNYIFNLNAPKKLDFIKRALKLMLTRYTLLQIIKMYKSEKILDRENAKEHFRQIFYNLARFDTTLNSFKNISFWLSNFRNE